MNEYRQRTLSGLVAILSVFSLGVAARSLASEVQKQTSKEDKEKPSISIRMEDLPKPVQDVMDTIKNVGNRVGDEIPKATSAVTGAVKKAVKPDTDTESHKERN